MATVRNATKFRESGRAKRLALREPERSERARAAVESAPRRAAARCRRQVREKAKATLCHLLLDDPHPSRAGNRLAPVLVEVFRLDASEDRAEHPDPLSVAPILKILGVDFEVTKAPRPALIATIETAQGPAELR